VTPTRP